MNGPIISSRNMILVLLAAVFTLVSCGAVTLQIKANSALQAKRYDEALAAYQEILKTDPANVGALKGIGETYLMMKKAPEAATALEKAYKIDPDRQTIITLGLAYSETGDYGKAIATWDVLLAREPESNVANLVKKHRTLVLYKDAARQAKDALAQERVLISDTDMVGKKKSPAAAVVSASPAPAPHESVQVAPPPKSSKTTKRSPVTRKARTTKQGKPAVDAKAALPPKTVERAAALAEARARAAALSKEKLEKAFPVDTNTLAVSPFGEKGNTEKTKHLRKALAAMIITDLSKAKGIRVVERVRMQKLLDELKLGQSGIVDPGTSPRVGRLLGAGNIVSGSMLGAGADNLHIIRILTNVSTGKDLGDQDAQGKVDEFFNIQKVIVFGILKDLGIKLTPSEGELISRYATRSYKGLRLYGEGLDWQDLGEWDKAIQVFQQCVIEDPTGPCGPALAGAPSSGDATAGPDGVAGAIGQAGEADVAATASAGAGGGGCFLPNTLVLTASGPRPIAQIRSGESLLTRNEQGEIVVDTVAKTLTFTNNHHFILNGAIRVTGAHRLFTADGWKRAMDLKIGDRIRTNEGTFAVILSKEALPGMVKVHNLEMTVNRNFFVSPDGKTGYLVHNSK